MGTGGVIFQAREESGGGGGRIVRRASPRLVFHPRRHETSVRVQRRGETERKCFGRAIESRISFSVSHVTLGKIGWFSRNLATKSRRQTLNRSTQKRKLSTAGRRENLCGPLRKRPLRHRSTSVIWTPNRIRVKNPIPVGNP